MKSDLKTVRLDTPKTDIHDEKLVEMAIDGNEMAFHLLMERHKTYVARLASRFLFSMDDVQDVVQDTFIRVWKNMAGFDPHNRFTTWLYTVTINLCLDRLKALKRKSEVQLTDETLQRFTTCLTDDHETRDPDSSVIAKAIREYSARLGKVQRLVFVLRDLHDLSVEEVCDITGFKPDKVKANLFYARKFMREKLVNGGYL
jgi:RNA polymerase sigma-70 factor, ECF subfamily